MLNSFTLKLLIHASHSQRQAASVALVELTQSQHLTLKILAAENLPAFFSEFEPEHQERVTDAVLDLCEDVDEQV